MLCLHFLKLKILILFHLLLLIHALDANKQNVQSVVSTSDGSIQQRSNSPSRENPTCHTDEGNWCIFSNLKSDEILQLHSDKNSSSDVRKLMFQQSTIKLFSGIFCAEFRQLQNLDLKTLSIEVLLEDAFAFCSELKWLSLHGNKIKNLPPKIFYANTNLEYLFLSKNQLKEIDCDLLKNQEKLVELHIASNQLEEFPLSTLRQAKDLMALSMHSNNLIDVNETAIIEQFPKLRSIWFAGNELACIRVIEILRTFEERGIALSPYQDQIPRFYDTSKVESITCLPDTAWAAVHYRKNAMNKLGKQNCQ